MLKPGSAIGYWHNEVGELNQLWHLWASESMNERAGLAGHRTALGGRVHQARLHQRSGAAERRP